MAHPPHGDSFRNDRHPDLRADYILVNPPFNASDWGGEQLRDDKRWEHGILPTGNANFAWVQHILYHLAPRGIAGIVLANGSMSPNQSGEGEIGETLFIDARTLGHMLDRTRRDLSREDITRVADTYYAWRDGKDAGEYDDMPGFCKTATLDEIRKHGHVLTPGRYVGAAPQEADGEPFEEKMTRLLAQWTEQQAEAHRLDVAIEANLERLGFGAKRGG